MFSNRQWWILAVGTFGLGDYVTTKIALSQHPDSTAEGNPFAAGLIDRFGYEGVAGVKAVALAMGYLLNRRASGARDRGVISEELSHKVDRLPVMVALLGAFVTLNNANQIRRSRDWERRHSQ